MIKKNLTIFISTFFVFLALLTSIFLFAMGRNPLWFFVSKHSYTSTQIALRLGFNPNSCEQECPLFIAAVFQDLRMIQILVDHGADIHILDKHHGNVLNNSCTNVEILDYFIARGVDVNNQELDRAGKPGMTPLLCAASNNAIDAVKFLLSKGADKTKAMAQWAGRGNVTPLQIAQSKNFSEIAKLLQ